MEACDTLLAVRKMTRIDPQATGNRIMTRIASATAALTLLALIADPSVASVQILRGAAQQQRYRSYTNGQRDQYQQYGGYQREAYGAYGDFGGGRGMTQATCPLRDSSLRDRSGRGSRVRPRSAMGGQQIDLGNPFDGRRSTDAQRGNPFRGDGSTDSGTGNPLGGRGTSNSGTGNPFGGGGQDSGTGNPFGGGGASNSGTGNPFQGRNP